ncbi:MAG: DUF2917 domain-containing protein [Treponema sp.]|nr:DUF2917 domain-containing protein [Treponema sp.]
MNLKATTILESLGMPSIETSRDLADDQALSIKLEGRITVYCVAGSLWVTLEKDGEDILIAAGQTRSIEGRGRLVISALQDSKFYVG